MMPPMRGTTSSTMVGGAKISPSGAHQTCRRYNLLPPTTTFSRTTIPSVVTSKMMPQENATQKHHQRPINGSEISPQCCPRSMEEQAHRLNDAFQKTWCPRALLSPALANNKRHGVHPGFATQTTCQTLEDQPYHHQSITAKHTARRPHAPIDLRCHH